MKNLLACFLLFSISISAFANDEYFTLRTIYADAWGAPIESYSSVEPDALISNHTFIEPIKWHRAAWNTAANDRRRLNQGGHQQRFAAHGFYGFLLSEPVFVERAADFVFSLQVKNAPSGAGERSMVIPGMMGEKEIITDGCLVNLHIEKKDSPPVTPFLSHIIFSWDPRKDIPNDQEVVSLEEGRYEFELWTSCHPAARRALPGDYGYRVVYK